MKMMKMKNRICCKYCNCNIFVVKVVNKKPNKNKEFVCFLNCFLCKKKLILKKGTPIKLIKCKYQKRGGINTHKSKKSCL